MEQDRQADGLLASDGDATVFVNTSAHYAHPGRPQSHWFEPNLTGSPYPPKPRHTAVGPVMCDSGSAGALLGPPIRGSRYASRPLAVQSEESWNQLSVRAKNSKTVSATTKICTCSSQNTVRQARIFPDVRTA
jgi:hypothetical protein